MATGILIYANLGEHPDALRAGRTPNKIRKTFLSGEGRSFREQRQYGQASRPISTARLSVSRRLHLQPINLVFSQGPSEGLQPWGCLISGRASRLDAFSGYPFRT